MYCQNDETDQVNGIKLPFFNFKEKLEKLEIPYKTLTPEALKENNGYYPTELNGNSSLVNKENGIIALFPYNDKPYLLLIYGKEQNGNIDILDSFNNGLKDKFLDKCSHIESPNDNFPLKYNFF